MPETVVPLTRPIVTHDGNVTEVVVKEPSGRDWIQLGEPYVFTTQADGEEVGHPVPDVLDGYFERCVIKPAPHFLTQLSLADGMRVRQAILAFFPVAAKAAFPKASTSSSSTSESAPQTPGSISA